MSQGVYLAARYWHTLRYLKPIQIYGRAVHVLHRPSTETGVAPKQRGGGGIWKAPAPHPSVMLSPNSFRFLNEDGQLNNESSWNDPRKTKLWLYNLHYFDDLTATESETRRDWHRALIGRWIAENPALAGNGWEPYPLSRRIVNWIKWALAGNSLERECHHSLAVQTRYLARRLEWHLLGNHLFANAKALIFAGYYFDGQESDAWLNKGLSILEREISEQILPDGGHFELSPMYHSIILEDILDLINLGGAYGNRLPARVIETWCHRAEAMLDWLAVMCHPSGDIGLFNDAAFGVAAVPNKIEAYAERLGLTVGRRPNDGVTRLVESGYVRVQRGDMVALLDVARIGPDYIPGHAHADTLSFELSLSGKQVIVNSGISEYGTGQLRQYQRSTAAHSTAEVDGENSSEVWGGFRVARRAKPLDLSIIDHPSETIVRCAHDGYRRLKGRVTHQRQWRFRDRSLEVTDAFTGTYNKGVVRFFFHPAVKHCADIKRTTEVSNCSLSLPIIGAGQWCVSGGDCSLVRSEYYPEFGRSDPNDCLEVTMTAPQCALTLRW